MRAGSVAGRNRDGIQLHRRSAAGRGVIRLLSQGQRAAAFLRALTRRGAAVTSEAREAARGRLDGRSAARTLERRAAARLRCDEVSSVRADVGEVGGRAAGSGGR